MLLLLMLLDNTVLCFEKCLLWSRSIYLCFKNCSLFADMGHCTLECSSNFPRAQYLDPAIIHMQILTNCQGPRSNVKSGRADN